MNNDLISRDALKEDFKVRYHSAEKWIEKAADAEIKIRATATRDFIVEVIMTIDNAPTVDAIPNAEGYEMYNKGYVQGYERGKAEARPQGERAERALSIIDRLYTEGHINNMEQGVLRRAVQND